MSTSLWRTDPLTVQTPPLLILAKWKSSYSPRVERALAVRKRL
jgi:hypothetical protein